MTDINVQSLDPAERDWEYDDDGTRIYKVKMGKPHKTPYNDDYETWKQRFGHDWEPVKDKEKYIGVKEPYYVDLP